MNSVGFGLLGGLGNELASERKIDSFARVTNTGDDVPDNNLDDAVEKVSKLLSPIRPTFRATTLLVFLAFSAWPGLAQGQSVCTEGEDFVFMTANHNHWGASGLRVLIDGRYESFTWSATLEDSSRPDELDKHQWNTIFRFTPDELAAIGEALSALDLSRFEGEYDPGQLARDGGPTTFCIKQGDEIREIVFNGTPAAFPELAQAFDTVQTFVTAHWGTAAITSRWELRRDGEIVFVETPCDPDSIPALRELFELFASFETEHSTRDENPSATEILVMTRFVDGFTGSYVRVWDDNLITVESGSLHMLRRLTDEQMAQVGAAIEAIDWASVATHCP